MRRKNATSVTQPEQVRAKMYRYGFSVPSGGNGKLNSMAHPSVILRHAGAVLRMTGFNAYSVIESKYLRTKPINRPILLDPGACGPAQIFFRNL
jgi:hypothetical protein